MVHEYEVGDVWLVGQDYCLVLSIDDEDDAADFLSLDEGAFYHWGRDSAKFDELIYRRGEA